ncbi:hypothetical protein Moror_9341 [Moniliophthora roreri MCA 2997]|uniref:DUF6534 domain-containing protein n=2 Tax=Moniliophthora roreri TaxID=221103 RepID=V2Y369_MONRO|nr:hypothetical protein Moror_9341 [Moniliophthora roreri MCA 2997]
MSQPLTLGKSLRDITRQDITWIAFPRLIGFAFNWALIGALCVQVYAYHIVFRGDRLVFKLLVYVLFVLDWIQTISATYDACQWFAFRWGDPKGLDQLYTEWLNVPILTSIIGGIVQTFFGWKIWAFSRSKFLFIVIVVMAGVQLAAAAMVARIVIASPDESANHKNNLAIAVAVRLVTSATADIIITSCMTFFLLRRRERYSPQTNAIVAKVARLTLETNSITATVAIADLLCFIMAKKSAFHQIFGVTLSKLYTNSLMMVFNNRDRLLNSWNGVRDNSFELPGFKRGRKDGELEPETDFDIELRMFHETFTELHNEDCVPRTVGGPYSGVLDRNNRVRRRCSVA